MTTETEPRVAAVLANALRMFYASMPAEVEEQYRVLRGWRPCPARPTSWQLSQALVGVSVVRVVEVGRGADGRPVGQPKYVHDEGNARVRVLIRAGTSFEEYRSDLADVLARTADPAWFQTAITKVPHQWARPTGEEDDDDDIGPLDGDGEEPAAHPIAPAAVVLDSPARDRGPATELARSAPELCAVLVAGQRWSLRLADRPTSDEHGAPAAAVVWPARRVVVVGQQRSEAEAVAGLGRALFEALRAADRAQRREAA